ncbi:hypothetical protein IE4803_CH01171 [Rhizobium etli bv. phaseoli str. IE4803]|nr:hypothetical protein IE4803_CH01171 [Rhizobium etli bv. phaseoli str. IE4803]
MIATASCEKSLWKENRTSAQMRQERRQMGWTRDLNHHHQAHLRWPPSAAGMDPRLKAEEDGMCGGASAKHPADASAAPGTRAATNRQALNPLAFAP